MEKLKFLCFLNSKVKIFPPKATQYKIHERSDSSVVDTEQLDSSEFETAVDTELPHWSKWIALYIYDTE